MGETPKAMRTYPLHKITMHQNPDDFAMRAIKLADAGWTVHSFQVVWPAGEKPSIAAMWTKPAETEEGE